VWRGRGVRVVAAELVVVISGAEGGAQQLRLHLGDGPSPHGLGAAAQVGGHDPVVHHRARLDQVGGGLALVVGDLPGLAQVTDGGAWAGVCHQPAHERAHARRDLPRELRALVEPAVRRVRTEDLVRARVKVRVRVTVTVRVRVRARARVTVRARVRVRVRVREDQQQAEHGRGQLEGR